MNPILKIQDINLLDELKNQTIVFETDNFEIIEQIHNAVQKNNHLFCIKLNVNQDITSINFKEEWGQIPLVIYPAGLGAVRDFVTLLPVLKKMNVKFFLDSAEQQNYEAVQILSSLGIYSGIVINKNADWEKLTDLMYYALCGKAAHAPIEPFQYLYDMYQRNLLVDYGTVFFENPEMFDFLTAKSAKDMQRAQRVKPIKTWQSFFYEATPCAACEGWRICLGKYAEIEDKIECQTFTIELLNLIENIKPINP
ncbi:MAG: hypothetical protein LBU83_08405 [Bacteroidales bacterium]|jgi:hypothetical protein|nr:hypothetical protein [Bacteroidales bacterium]